MKFKPPTLQKVEMAELDAAAAELLEVPRKTLRALKRRAGMLRLLWEVSEQLMPMATASAGVLPDAD